MNRSFTLLKRAMGAILFRRERANSQPCQIRIFFVAGNKHNFLSNRYIFFHPTVLIVISNCNENFSFLIRTLCDPSQFKFKNSDPDRITFFFRIAASSSIPVHSFTVKYKNSNFLTTEQNLLFLKVSEWFLIWFT